MSYNFQRSATRVKGVEVNDNTADIVLPVDTMEVMARPFVPEGGTLQRDYDENGWFEPPTFALVLEMEWAYERTDARPTVYDTLQDLIAEYMNGNAYDFFVKYENGSYDSNYKCPHMLPAIEEDSGGIMFNQRAREKARSITLESQSSTLLWSDVSFTYD